MMRSAIPWGILLALSPLALWGIWQIIGKWRFRYFYPTALLGLCALLALAIARGFADILVWAVLLLALLWFMNLAALPMTLVGLMRRRLRWSMPMRGFTALAFLALVGISLYAAYQPVIRRTTLTLDKPLERPVRILLASDLHLHWLFGNRELDWLADTAQRERADLVLLPGDIINDRPTAYHARHMQPHLARLRAPLGVYATLGNHEFYGDADENARVLRDAGITVLRDEAVEIEGKLIILGRDDDHQRARKTPAAILSGHNLALPVILLDHRPTHLHDNAAAGADLQVSGHAHNGQIFPANLIVKRLYDLHYGQAQIENMHAIVTSGYGFWGIPMRLGSRSEVWLIELHGRATP